MRKNTDLSRDSKVVKFDNNTFLERDLEFWHCVHGRKTVWPLSSGCYSPRSGARTQGNLKNGGRGFQEKLETLTEMKKGFLQEMFV
jgi:hypothetical protein